MADWSTPVRRCRAAAKNHAHVTVVVDPADYQPLLDKLASGEDMADFRRQLAWKAFQVCGSTVTLCDAGGQCWYKGVQCSLVPCGWCRHGVLTGKACCGYHD